MPQVGTELKNALGTGRVRETRRADQKQGLPLGRTAALQAPRGIPRIPPGSAAGEAISGYRRNYRRRLRLRGVACSVQIEFLPAFQPSCRNVRPREHEQENQDGINRDRHGVSGRIPPIRSKLGYASGCANLVEGELDATLMRRRKKSKPRRN